MDKNTPEFVRCTACRRANAADAVVCRSCNAAIAKPAYVSLNPYESPTYKPRSKALWITLLVAGSLAVPLFFAFKWVSTYGQVSVDKMSTPETSIGPRLPWKEEMPENAWYKSTLKSWIWAEPSVEDVLAKDIEAAGGWKALKKTRSFEIEAIQYGYSCKTISLFEMTSPEKLAASPSQTMSMKFEVPNKFYKMETLGIDPASQQLRTLLFNGKAAFSCDFVNKSEWVCESAPAEGAFLQNFSFFTAATDYTKQFSNFSYVNLGKLNKRVVYSLPAYSSHPMPGELIASRELMFDVITGRMVGVRVGNSLVRFEDFKKVGEASLPHRICVGEEDADGSTLIIKSWKMNTQIDDSIFERPAK